MRSSALHGLVFLPAWRMRRVHYVSLRLCGVSWRSRLLELLDERDVVALQQDLADIAPLLWCILLREGDFDSVVDNEVHEFVETPQLSLNAHAQVLVQPYRDGRP